MIEIVVVPILGASSYPRHIETTRIEILLRCIPILDLYSPMPRKSNGSMIIRPDLRKIVKSNCKRQNHDIPISSEYQKWFYFHRNSDTVSRQCISENVVKL